MALPHFRLPVRYPIPSVPLAYLQAARNYTILYFEDGSSEVYSKTLKLFEASLPAEHFVRISKSYLVRRDYIDGYVTKNEIRLKNGVPLKVARRRRL
jgi:DNA-binding LytR/AlgR family response regulator